MSFLEKFRGDFNCLLDIYKPTIVKNSIWEEEETFSLYQEWIEWLLFLDNKDKNYINNEVEYIKSTHKIRIEKDINIEKWDKLINKDWKSYKVKFIKKVTWFIWKEDHILILASVMS